MKASDQIREYAGRQYVEPVRSGTGTTVRIKAGDVVNGLRLKNKTPNVCSALRSKIFQEQYGVQLIGEQGPPSGMSTTVVFTYNLLNQERSKRPNPGPPSAFDRLRGIAKTAFKGPGDWERSIQRDRRNFYGKADSESERKRG